MLDNLFLYGNTKRIDLHGLTKEEARAELLHLLNSIDSTIDCIIVIHGFNTGNVLKNMVRKEFKHELIDKMVFVDAGVTAIKIKKL